MFRMSGYESEYLDEKLMAILPGLLSELSILHPKDPIEWLVAAIRIFALKVLTFLVIFSQYTKL